MNDWDFFFPLCGVHVWLVVSDSLNCVFFYMNYMSHSAITQRSIGGVSDFAFETVTSTSTLSKIQIRTALILL